MASLFGWFGTLVGIVVAALGMIMVLRYSPLVGPLSSIELVYLWAIIFIVGVLMMGWGMAKIVTP